MQKYHFSGTIYRQLYDYPYRLGNAYSIKYRLPVQSRGGGGFAYPTAGSFELSRV